MEFVGTGRFAMATRFEVIAVGADRPHLLAAAEAALDEVQRLDKRLSFYNPSSEVSYLNRLAFKRPVKLDPQIFQLIARAKEISEKTNGAFDIAVGALKHCWETSVSQGREPVPEEIQKALENTGSSHIHLDTSDYTISFDTPGLSIDLGAIAKGYAIDMAVEILTEAGVESFIIHAGTSTVYARGKDQSDMPWRVAIPNIEVSKMISLAIDQGNTNSKTSDYLRIITLDNESLSVSAIWGRFFGGSKDNFLNKPAKYGHIIDPRTGWPVEKNLMSMVALKSATETDALSTALIVLGVAGVDLIEKIQPLAKVILCYSDSTGDSVIQKGFFE